MTPSFDHLVKQLKKLPGLGFRSAERIALHLLVEKPENTSSLVEALESASKHVNRCNRCGNLAEDSLCSICQDSRRDESLLCVVEQVPDLMAIESSGSFRGLYHVLHGKLSPIKGIGPDQLNFEMLQKRLEEEQENLKKKRAQMQRRGGENVYTGGFSLKQAQSTVSIY